MRVRLQYGIDDSSLPNKIKELLREAESLSELQNNKLTAAKALLYSTANIEMVASLLEDARRSLVEIDQSLADVHAIAKGYADHLRSQQAPVGSPTPMQPARQAQPEPPPPSENYQSNAPSAEQLDWERDQQAKMADIINQMGEALNEQDQE